MSFRNPPEGAPQADREVSHAKINQRTTVAEKRRVNIACPGPNMGPMPNHVPFKETAQIVTISKFGARLKTPISFTSE